MHVTSTISDAAVIIPETRAAGIWASIKYLNMTVLIRRKEEEPAMCDIERFPRLKRTARSLKDLPLITAVTVALNTDPAGP
jgi:hypothetical protein